MSNHSDWHPISTAPEGVKVETAIIDDKGQRNTAALTRSGRLWFAGNMYVYYSPTHWRDLPSAPGWQP